MKLPNRRLWLPIGLLALSVYGLVGCIPIPTTQQYMTNGNAKPSWKIGKGKSDPIQIGQTHINDAMAFLNQHLSGPNTAPPLFMHNRREVTPEVVKARWFTTNDRKKFLVPYDRRTMFWVYPICFMAMSDQTTEYLALDVATDGRVTGYRILKPSDLRMTQKEIDQNLVFPKQFQGRQAVPLDGTLIIPATQPATEPTTEPTTQPQG